MIISLAPWRRERSSLSAAMSLGAEQIAAGGTSVRNGLKKEKDRWHPMTNGRHLRLMKCVLWCNAIWYDAIWHDMMKCDAMWGDVMFCTVDTIWHIYYIYNYTVGIWCMLVGCMLAGPIRHPFLQWMRYTPRRDICIWCIWFLVWIIMNTSIERGRLEIYRYAVLCHDMPHQNHPFSSFFLWSWRAICVFSFSSRRWSQLADTFLGGCTMSWPQARCS